MARLTFLRFLRDQWTSVPTLTGATAAQGKTIIVTGAEGGLGLDSARQLAKLSSNLILTSRNPTDSPKPDINGSVKWTQINLASFDSVRTFVDGLGSQKIDGLLANAAIATRKYTLTDDGWESTIQINYLSNALLTVLLLPNMLKHSTEDHPARVAIVASDAHFQFTWPSNPEKMGNVLRTFNKPENSTPSAMKQRYMFSKLLTVIFVRELARRLKTSNVIVTAVNPGFCHSRLTREAEASLVGKMFIPPFKALIAKSTEQGAAALTHSMTVYDPAPFQGHYVTNGVVTEESDLILGDAGLAISARVMTETLQILRELDPRVPGILSEYLSPDV